MVRKLSHPVPIPDAASGPTREPTDSRVERRAPGRPTRFVSEALVVACALASLTSFACNRIDAEDTARVVGEPSQTGAPKAPSEQHDASAERAEFAWPDDPSHTVLRIAVDAPDFSGTIEIELMPELAPKAVASVHKLAQEGFYDGTTFHRVIPGFMIQGGDPKSRDRDPRNDGKGGPGYEIVDEFSEAPFVRGIVGLGNKGRVDSGGSQFFIMQEDGRGLDGRYSVIGRVRKGMEIVDAIAGVETDRFARWGAADRPIENVTLTRVEDVGQVSALEQAEALESSTKTASAPTGDKVGSPREAGGKAQN